jgi:hypothetical protein
VEVDAQTDYAGERRGLVFSPVKNRPGYQRSTCKIAELVVTEKDDTANPEITQDLYFSARPEASQKSILS